MFIVMCNVSTLGQGNTPIHGRVEIVANQHDDQVHARLMILGKEVLVSIMLQFYTVTGKSA